MSRATGVCFPAPRNRHTFLTHAPDVREKLRLKHYYGLSERQLRRYAETARRQPGDTGEALLLLCERRLDNVIRRAGFAPTRLLTRQAIAHGHIRVNGRKVTRPGYLVRAGDVVAVTRRAKVRAEHRALLAQAGPPAHWLAVEPQRLRAVVTRLPAAADLPRPADVQVVVQLLSR